MDNYKNPVLSAEERTEDLLSRMTLEQKIDQLTCLVTIESEIPDFQKYVPDGIGHVGAFTTASCVEKIAEYVYSLQKFLTQETELGIPALIHCEASAGAQFTEADVFPSAIAQASTFEPDLIERMAEIIRRQMLQVGFRQALSPVVDIARDPRWGRVTETYGEDAALTSAMASAFVRGIQTDDLREGIAATAKHYVGHGITEGGINMGRNMVSPRDLKEIHCKPFQSAITEAGMRGVMCSYCSMNGEPVVASKRLLTDILRDEMGFEGIVVSDYVAGDRLVVPFCVADSFEKAGNLAIQAGLDVEYPRPKGFTYQMKAAVEAGELPMEVIDRAVRRVLKLKFELGLFENPYPNVEALKKTLHCKDTEVLNEELAQKSFILLKNENKLLPLSKNIKKIAVLGPHGDNVRSYFGTFSYPAALDMSLAREEDGQEFEEPGLIIYDIEQAYVGQIREVSPRIGKRITKEFPAVRSLYHALQEYLPDCQVVYAQGINCAGSDVAGMEEALRVAADADVVLLTLGGKNGWGITSTVGEGVDSTDIDLPGRQEEFARKVYALHKKTVVLHFDGRPLSNVYVASHFDAILEVWQPGVMGGQALCKTLFGAYNPGGRLPVTAARTVGQLPVYYGLPRGSGYVAAGHTGMIRNKNGYINDTAYPLYYFGHGLSYTTFAYSDARLYKDKVTAQDILQVSVVVENTGELPGDEVVQLYFTDQTASMVRPTMELAGFQRISLASGEKKEVTFRMKVSQMAFLDRNDHWVVEQGVFTLSIGASCVDIRQRLQVEVTAGARVEERTRGFYAQTAVKSL